MTRTAHLPIMSQKYRRYAELFQSMNLYEVVVIHRTNFNLNFYKYKKIRGFESASELYRSSDRRQSAKLVPTLVDRGCRVVSATSPPIVTSFSRPGAVTISSK
jgi:hypothetical protein